MKINVGKNRDKMAPAKLDVEVQKPSKMHLNFEIVVPKEFAAHLDARSFFRPLFCFVRRLRSDDIKNEFWKKCGMTFGSTSAVAHRFRNHFCKLSEGKGYPGQRFSEKNPNSSNPYPGNHLHSASLPQNVLLH